MKLEWEVIGTGEQAGIFAKTKCGRFRLSNAGFICKNPIRIEIADSTYACGYRSCGSARSVNGAKKQCETLKECVR